MRSKYAIESARQRVAGVAVTTPVIVSPRLSDLTGADVRLKLECLQVTGSFKVRGAASKLLALSEDEARHGVIACSSGNHGLATAYVARLCGIPAIICVPEWADPVKLGAMRESGATVVVEGATYDEAEDLSFRLRDERELTYVHPFDDPEVIAGQGTIGLELLEQLPELDTVVVPVAGGGLIGGIAAALRDRAPRVRVVGAYAARAPVMARSVAAGRPLSMPEEETVATALAGGIGDPNRHTLALVRDLVDELLEVPEEAILDAIRFAYRRHRLIVEGGGAVALAAIRDQPGRWRGTVAVVVSGGNIDLRRLQSILEDSPPGKD